MAQADHEEPENAKPSSDDGNNWEIALKKLGFNYGVLSYLVLSKSGIPVYWYKMDSAEQTRYAGLIGGEKGGLASLAQDFLKVKLSCPESQRIIMTGDEEALTIRLRTFKNEIIISPYKDLFGEEFTLVVVQNPNISLAPKSEGAVVGQEQET